jgi:hypothetical protein
VCARGLVLFVRGGLTQKKVLFSRERRLSNGTSKLLASKDRVSRGSCTFICSRMHVGACAVGRCRWAVRNVGYGDEREESVITRLANLYGGGVLEGGGCC